MLNSLENRKKITIHDWIIPVYYVLAQYQIKGGITFGLLLLCFYIVYSIFKNKYLPKFNPIYFLFIFMFLFDLIKATIIEPNLHVFNSWVPRIIFLLFLVMADGETNEDNLYKVWSFLGLIAIIALFVQAIQVYALDQEVGIIKILPTFGEEIFNRKLPRPTSFFHEPSSFAFWITPLLFMAMKKQNILFATIITISIFLSTSTTGILTAIFLWIYFILFDKKLGRNKKMVVILIFIIAGILFFTLDMFDYSRAKLFGQSHDSNSNKVRMLLGPTIWITMPFGYKVLSVPFYNVGDYVLYGQPSIEVMELVSDPTRVGFLNTIAQFAILYGLGGLIAFLYVYFYLFKHSNLINKGYVILCFVLSFGTGNFMNSAFLLDMSCLMLFLNNQVPNKDIREKNIDIENDINKFSIRNVKDENRNCNDTICK